MLSRLSRYLKWKNKYKSRKKFNFLINGAVMLERQIALFNGNCNPIRTYSIEDLNRATNNFHSDNMFYSGSLYEMYSGIVLDGHQVCVKKLKYYGIREHEGDSLDMIMNEAAIASQMSKHKNVLKLLGCYLESDLPILVYEFPANGSLVSILFTEQQVEPLLPWETKLKIATQVAYSIAYFHHGLSKTIVHRGLTVGNIFLDKDYVAKLSEFQTSLVIPAGETHVEAPGLIGTVGLIPPELLGQRRLYTEKTDVYSFGNLLSVILTEQDLSESFIRWLYLLPPLPLIRTSVSGSGNEGAVPDMSEDDCSEQYVANPNNESGEVFREEAVEALCRIMEEKNKLQEENRAQLMECVKLINRCLKTNPNERPDMMEVTKALRLINSM